MQDASSNSLEDFMTVRCTVDGGLHMIPSSGHNGASAGEVSSDTDITNEIVQDDKQETNAPTSGNQEEHGTIKNGVTDELEVLLLLVCFFPTNKQL